LARPSARRAMWRARRLRLSPTPPTRSQLTPPARRLLVFALFSYLESSVLSLPNKMTGTPGGQLSAFAFGLTRDPARLELIKDWDAAKRAEENARITEENKAVQPDAAGNYVWQSLLPSPDVSPRSSRSHTLRNGPPQDLAALLAGIDPAMLHAVLLHVAGNAGGRRGRGRAPTLAKSPSPPMPPPAAAPYIISMQGAKHPDKSGTDLLRTTHSLVLQLIDYKHYLLLTLFTRAAQERLLLAPELLKRAPFTIDNKKVFLLDVTQFGDKNEISEADWRAAQSAYTACMGERSTPDVRAFFLEHFLFFENQPEVSTLFDVTRTTNIHLRRSWHAECFLFSNAFYAATWERFKADWRYLHPVTAVSTPSAPVTAQSGKAPRSRFTAGDRHSPYASPSVGTPGVEERSFWLPKSIPLCAICLVEGHAAWDCKVEKTPSGKDTFCRYDTSAKKLVSRQHGDRVCVLWNISSNRCDKPHADGSKHICSLCGSPNHTGRARACTP
jgi:hypothetical protein